MSKKENLTRILLCILAIIFALIFVSWSSNTIEDKKYIDTIQTSMSNGQYFLAFDNKINEVENKKDSIKAALIKEVENYVFKRAPEVHRTIPKYLVNKSLNENIDLCFVLAQTEQETNYGTLGMGRECSRRSLFGVMKEKYSSYNEAIDDYFNILKEKYLSKGKTEKHLLKNYINNSGRRYAENPNYEIALNNKYLRISKSTKIQKLQKAYNDILI